ncbi:MAG: 50S ribosomal protein L13 [Oscillospiraceae bacterium]|jgi:large subunit ribosomal protein L13|nr:50S ribosomal protein L13 [Oscillospiraceae bacterium]
MSTFMANRNTVTRKWYILDAAGKPLGKTAATAAVLLRGKHKPDYTPHVDCGDFVIVLNAEKAVLTGKKLEQKYYRTHSGYAGGLKEVKYRLLMKDKPELAMKLAVRGMMPRNSISSKAQVRLKVFRSSEHPHAAQKPEPWTAE